MHSATVEGRLKLPDLAATSPLTLTVVATLKQQQRNVLEYLTAACEAALRGEAAPSLLPASNQKAQAAA